MAEKLKKPLNTWEKVKTGTVSAVESVMNYIPRGIIMSAVMVGISSAVASMGGPNLMGTFEEMQLGGFLTRTATVVGIGSVINGSIGAYKGIKQHTEFRNKEIELQEKSILQDQARGRSKEKSSSVSELEEEVVSAAHGLPSEIGKATLGI